MELLIEFYVRIELFIFNLALFLIERRKNTKSKMIEHAIVGAEVRESIPLRFFQLELKALALKNFLCCLAEKRAHDDAQPQIGRLLPFWKH